MIIRPEQHWFLRLFDWHGSVLSKIIFRLLLNVLMSIIAIISYQWYEQLGIHLTVAPFSLLGIAIAIFSAFATAPATAGSSKRAICGGRCLSPNVRWYASCAISCRPNTMSIAASSAIWWPLAGA